MIVMVVAVMLPWSLLNQRQFNYFGVAIGRGFGLFIRVFDIDRLEPPPDTRLPEIRKMLDYGVATQYSPATFVQRRAQAPPLFGGAGGSTDGAICARNRRSIIRGRSPPIR